MEKGSQELATILQNSQGLVERATSFLLDSDKQLETASEVISVISGFKQQIEEKRKSYVAPLNAQVKKINKEYKGYLAPLEQADWIMRNKMVCYRQEQEFIKAKEEGELRKEAEKISKKEGISVEEVLASQKIEELPKSNENATFSKHWAYQVNDIAKVPKNYLQIDSVKVMNAIRSGVREIAGITIFQETRVSTK